MKPLVTFIKESFEDTKVEDLVVYYDVKNGEDVVVQAPQNYSEDDLTLYLGDKWFKEFPGNSSQSKNVFGNNVSRLIDMHFEYDSFEHKKEYDGKIDVEWDNEYDTKNVEDSEIDTFIISNLRFILTFESFELKIYNPQDVDEDLLNIFKTTESSSLNKYPVELYLDKETPIEYKRDD